MAQKSGRCDLRVYEYTASRTHKSRLFGNRWLPQTTRADCAPDIQAIFRRRRHQPRRPTLAKIRPGSPAPVMGPGTLKPTRLRRLKQKAC
jgi:hypothetical protein